jgi:hypothetical protein
MRILEAGVVVAAERRRLRPDSSSPLQYNLK